MERISFVDAVRCAGRGGDGQRAAEGAGQSASALPRGAAGGEVPAQRHDPPRAVVNWVTNLRLNYVPFTPNPVFPTLARRPVEALSITAASERTNTRPPKLTGIDPRQGRR